MGGPLLRRALRGSNVHANLDLRCRHRGLPDRPGSLHILQVANNWRNTDICHKLHVWILICKKYYFQGSQTPTGEALSMRSPSIQLWAAFRFLLELVLMYFFRLILSLSSILVFLDICSDVVLHYECFPGNHRSSRAREKLPAQNTGFNKKKN